MRKFHIITLDSTREDLLDIEDYDIRNTDITKFWSAEKLPPDSASSMKLYINEPDSNVIDKTDAVGNPLSLFIFSTRLTILIYSYIAEDTQIFDIELNNNSGINIKDKFKIVHPFKSVDCLDLEQSGLSYSQDEEISVVGNCVIKEKLVPEDINIFRIKEDNNTIIVTDQLAGSLIGKGINSIAFIRCRSV